MIFHSLRKNSRPVIFSLLKYLEILVTGVTVFIVAKKIGPYEMGKSISSLLYITYSSYLALGLNQVVLKHFNRIKDEENRSKLLLFNLQYLLIAGFTNFFLAFIFIDKEYFLFVALIALTTILRSYFSSYYRVIDKIHVLNKNNLIFSFILLLFTLVSVNNWCDYLMYWAFSSLLCVVLFFFDDKNFFNSLILRVFSKPEKDKAFFYLKDGFYLALVGFLSTILLTTDRLIINFAVKDLNVKGVYQLGEHFGVAFYMLITTIFFYYYPSWISKIRESVKFRNLFYKRIKLGLIVSPILFVIFYLSVYVISNYIFIEYEKLENISIFIVIMKFLILIIGLLSIFYVSFDSEIKYLKSMVFTLLLYFITLIFFFLFGVSNTFHVPAIFSVILMIEVFKQMNFIKNKYL